MDLKSILEAHGAPCTIRVGVNNVTSAIEYPVRALRVEECAGGWLLLSCLYADAEGQEKLQYFAQARVREGKVMIRRPKFGHGWKTARALKRLGSDYAPILEKVQAEFDAVKP